MKTFCAIVLTLGLLASLGLAQPSITQISNAASASLSVPSTTAGVWQTLPNGNIAQGSFFSIYGTGLAADSATCGALVSGSPCIWPPSYPLPTALNGTQVSVTVSGTTVQAYVEFAAQFNNLSPPLAQVNAVLPSNTPVGTGTLTLTYSSQSTTVPITVVASSFGTFAFNAAGSGPGIIMNSKYSAFTPFHTATPGETVILWGTGLGPADPSTEQSAPPAVINLCGSGKTCPVTVWVGNQKGTVSFAGRSGYTAIDQINFTVPPGTQGCYVSVAVETTNGSSQVTSNFTSMAVDPNGAACQDADGINYGDISAAVTANKKASVGVISLLSNYLDIVGLALWDNDTVNGEIGTFTTAQLDAFQGFTLSPSVNNCTVSQFEGFPPPKDPILPGVTYLDAGAALSIKGASGTQPVPMNTDGEGYGNLVGGAYITCPASNPGCPNLLGGSGEPAFYLDSNTNIIATTYTVSGTGGSQVGAFSGPITVSSSAASFVWSNKSSVTAAPIPRSTPLTITWTGGDPNGYVDITAIASTVVGLLPAANTPGVLVECLVPSVPNSFSIPTFVLQAMPPSANNSLLAGEILVGPASGGVPITPTPSGLDAAYLFYHFINGQTVAWQ